ncbi:MAG: rhodanese-like domain-containing protein [Burkholderiaceae bacterium]
MIQQFLLQNLWLIGAALLSGGMLLWHMLHDAGAGAVAPAQAVALLNQKKAVLVDIRDAAVAAAQGTLSNARCIGLADLKAQADKLAKNKATPIIVFCQTGQRSAAAVTILKNAGYETVHALEGGLNAWQAAGLPLKRTVANG